jgi:hypothetical protein
MVGHGRGSLTWSSYSAYCLRGYEAIGRAGEMPRLMRLEIRRDRVIDAARHLGGLASP